MSDSDAVQAQADELRALTGKLSAERQAREKAESRLRELEELNVFRRTVERAPVAILQLDDEGGCIDANPAASKLLRRSRERITEGRLADLWPDDEAWAVRSMWERLLSEGRCATELPLSCADGTHLLVEIQATAHVAPGRHLAILRDVTAEREHAETLRQIAVLVSVGPGHEFLERLVQSLSKVLGAQLVYVGEFAEGTPRNLTILAAASCGDPVAVGGCEGPPAKNGPAEAAERLLGALVGNADPSAGLLPDVEIQGYIAAPLRDSADEIVGTLMIARTTSAEPSDRVRSLIDIFATRASGEIERRRARSRA
jgi:PAS domain S-box-containing protein